MNRELAVKPMTTHDDFIIKSVQVSGFAAGDQILRTSVLLKKLSTFWADRYTGEPVVLPIPQELPSDLPRLILTDDSGSSRFEAALNRINIFRNSSVGAIDLNHQFLSETSSEIESAFTAEEVDLGRLGLFIVRTAEVGEASGNAIARHFFKDRWLKSPFNRPESLEVHSHKVYPLQSGVPVNSWVRVKSGYEEDGKTPVVIVEQDLNTLEEERHNRSFTQNSVLEFYEMAARESEDILKLYFPKQDLSS